MLSLIVRMGLFSYLIENEIEMKTIRMQFNVR